jgi:serine protease Do
MTDLITELEHAAATVAERAGPATVAIGRAPRGSGVVIAEDRVLTNAHNLRDRTTQVTFHDRSAQATLLAADHASDLAVLEVDTTGIDPVEFSEHAPGLGAPVFALARGATGMRLSLGFVSGTDRSFRGPGGRQIGGSIEHTAPMARGSSGGPLLRADGTLAGLNTHRLGEGFYLSLAAEPSLVDRVGALAAGQVPRRSELGIAVAPPGVANRLRRSVGLDERDGVLVRAVAAGSAAEGAGLREGDLLVRAGDVDLSSPDELHRSLAAHDPAGAMTLRVVRGADELDVEVSFETRDDPTDDDAG